MHSSCTGKHSWNPCHRTVINALSCYSDVVQHNAAKKRSAEEVGPAKGITCSGEERGTKRRSEDGEGAAAVAKRQRLDQLIKAGAQPPSCMPHDCEPESIICFCNITVKTCEGLADYKLARGISSRLPGCLRQCRCSPRRPARRCGAGQGQGRGARRDAAAPGERGRALGRRRRHGEPVAGAAAALLPARPRAPHAPRARARGRCFLSTLPGIPAVSCRLRRLQEAGKACTACPLIACTCPHVPSCTRVVLRCP